MEFPEVLAKRRSVRHFNNKLAVTDDGRPRACCEAAVTAPTAGNIQPWRFVVVRSPERARRLAAAMGQKWATAAPVVIVVCVDPRPCSARYGARGEMLYADPGHRRRRAHDPARRGRSRARLVLDRSVRRRRRCATRSA